MELIIVILIVLIVLFVKSYNKLQRLAQTVRMWQSNIVATLVKYSESVNKLQDLLQGYASHEKMIFIKTSDNLVEMARETANAMARIQTMVQAYPAIQANETYKQLMGEVSRIQDELAQCRYNYNQAVAVYNGSIIALPESLYASALGFRQAPYYDPDHLQEARDFKTDDGTIVREMLKKGTSFASNQVGYGNNPYNQQTPNYGGQPGYGAPQQMPNYGGQPGYGAPQQMPNYGGQPGYGAPQQMPNYGGQPGYGGPQPAAPQNAQPQPPQPAAPQNTQPQPPQPAAPQSAQPQPPQPAAPQSAQPQPPQPAAPQNPAEGQPKP